MFSCSINKAWERDNIQAWSTTQDYSTQDDLIEVIPDLAMGSSATHPLRMSCSHAARYSKCPALMLSPSGYGNLVLVCLVVGDGSGDGRRIHGSGPSRVKPKSCLDQRVGVCHIASACSYDKDYRPGNALHCHIAILVP